MGDGRDRAGGGGRRWASNPSNEASAGQDPAAERSAGARRRLTDGRALDPLARLRVRGGARCAHCLGDAFTALDAGARLGLQARHVAVGDAQTYYSLDASVDKGAAWLSRAVQRRGFAAAETIAAPVASPAITAGRPVELELRVQGPTLSAWAGGAELFRVHDPTFGCGAFGIRAGRERRATRPVRVLCVGYEIREVAR